VSLRTESQSEPCTRHARADSMPMQAPSAFLKSTLTKRVLHGDGGSPGETWMGKAYRLLVS
jgi:hypothetical protein